MDDAERQVVSAAIQEYEQMLAGPWPLAPAEYMAFWHGWEAGRDHARAVLASSEREAVFREAADRMEQAILGGIRDGLRDCREACEHPACELLRARKAYRALVTQPQRRAEKG